MDTGPQKESDTPQEAGRQRREREKEKEEEQKEKGISRPGQRDRLEKTAIQTGRRQPTCPTSYQNLGVLHINSWWRIKLCRTVL